MGRLLSTAASRNHLAGHDRKEAMRRIRAGELEHPPARPRDDHPAPAA